MYRPQVNFANSPLNREQRIREAALLLFCNPVPEHCLRLFMLSESEWRRLLRWLDIAGFALYFFDRISELNLLGMLPTAVLERLQQNLSDNTERMCSMMEESTAIHHAFQSAGIFYVTLKGFSLWPESVSKLELRSQLDLDFLVTQGAMPEAQRILEARGYHLHAVSGRSWEFKTNQMPGASLKTMYKPTPYKCVELHVENGRGYSSLIERGIRRTIHGTSMPVLAPADLFLGQGMHLYKHVSSDFVRAAHLLEFRHHVLTRCGDKDFWAKLHEAAMENPHASFALGVITSLITQWMGNFAPEEFTSWTIDPLPPFAQLWVELYGARIIFAGFPGNKLYLLLQRELEAGGIPAKQSRRQALLPLRLPPAVIKAPAQENWLDRMCRYCGQIHFIFFRLHFHIAGGLGYLVESFRWKKYKDSLHNADSLPLHTSLPVKLQTEQKLPLISSTKE